MECKGGEAAGRNVGHQKKLSYLDGGWGYMIGYAK